VVGNVKDSLFLALHLARKLGCHVG
jgi:hypothetical protein